ncbi:energy transducer TonB [Rhizobium halophytocola]|uniref:Protein TonB n=1 Tax=Rhizobium halophytocola TaxID=735519 RepID=A0ABS4E263_9HYPH|nr:energy transducer TonB [Rhizobium halophytocola]MBP1852024.1 protein TonB [Rhizobium halophytocola]
MTLPPGQRRGFAFGELALWTCAAILVLAAHAGAVALLMQVPQDTAADAGPPAAIMIDLAPEPEAVETDDEQLTPDETDSEEIKSDTVEPPKEPLAEPPPEPAPEVQPTPPPEPPPVEPPPVEPPPPVDQPPQFEPEPEPPAVEPPPEPVEQVEEPPAEIDPLEEMALQQLENVEVPLPAARPAPPPKAAPQPVARKQAPAASKAATKAKAQVKQSDRNAAQQTAATSGSNAKTIANWQSRLMSHLQRRKRYPSAARRNREEGTAYVRFSIDASGNVRTVSVSRSSGSSALDQAVIDMVNRASPVPAPPPGANRTIVAPVRFNLR